MIERTFQKLAGPIMRRLQNMLARGVVKLSDAAKKMQALQLDLLAGETADNLEHFEPYGFTSRPLPGAEALAAFVDGDRSHGIVVVVADRRYRMTNFEEGEVAIHDDQGQSVHLKRDGIVITGAGKPILITGTPTVTIDTPLTILTGDLQLAGTLAMLGTQGLGTQLRGPLDIIGGTVKHDNVNIGKTHVHPENDSGGPTGPPQ